MNKRKEWAGKLEAQLKFWENFKKTGKKLNVLKIKVINQSKVVAKWKMATKLTKVFFEVSSQGHQTNVSA